MNMKVCSISGSGAPSSEEPGFCPNNKPLLSAGDSSREGDQVAFRDQVESGLYSAFQESCNMNSVMSLWGLVCLWLAYSKI